MIIRPHAVSRDQLRFLKLTEVTEIVADKLVAPRARSSSFSRCDSRFWVTVWLLPSFVAPTENGRTLASSVGFELPKEFSFSLFLSFPRVFDLRLVDAREYARKLLEAIIVSN